MVGNNPLLKISSDYIKDTDEFTTASIYAVNKVYGIAQGSVYDLDLSTNATNGVTITFKKNNNTSDYVRIGTITADVAKTGTETTPKTISAKVLDTKINDEITERIGEKFTVVDVTDLKGLKKQKENGWYKIDDTLNGVKATWIVTKMDNLYTATHSTDPRYVLNSVNLTDWYSPYAYWHAN